MKTALIAVASLFAGLSVSNAAQVIISNVVGGPGDTLYAYSNNQLMNTGIVTMGYFPSTVGASDINSVAGLLANLGSFTILTTAVPGTASPTLSGSFPGYAEQEATTTVPGGLITAVNNTLLNRAIFSIITDATTLASANATSQFAVVQIGKFLEDQPNENTYTSDPAGAVPILGKVGVFNGDAGPGAGEYKTLQMVPEASTALLGALGALGLLLRRR